ncbi:MAG: type II secretion system protein GspG [Planctomycetales bacterium]|nr:type II secretion system protein GspG [Planctomycetales bacterium]
MDAKQAYRMIRLAQTRNTCLILLTLCSCFATAHLAFIDLAAVGAYTFARRGSEAFSASLGDRRDSTAESTCRDIRTAVLAFEKDCGSVTTNFDDLWKRPSGAAGESWKGPYIDFMKFDPWGVEYRIEKTAGGLYPVKVRSAGPDQLHGTSDDIEV